jgi:hypothetical protein
LAETPLGINPPDSAVVIGVPVFLANALDRGMGVILVRNP